jgi:predicted nucleic acid-binding protein
MWLRTLIRSNTLTVSAQTLNETYWVVRRKPEFAHWRGGVRQALEDFARHATSPRGAGAIVEAWVIEDRYKVSFWDATQLATANAANCTYFLSEDLNDGQTYGTVKVINPFRHTPADVLGPALQP